MRITPIFAMMQPEMPSVPDSETLNAQDLKEIAEEIKAATAPPPPEPGTTEEELEMERNFHLLQAGEEAREAAEAEIEQDKLGEIGHSAQAANEIKEAIDANRQKHGDTQDKYE